MKLATSVRMNLLALWVIVLVSAAVAAGSYLQALNYQFVSDDVVYIAENTNLLGLHFAELWRLLTKPYNDFSEFLPLRDLSYWFDITLFGLNPATFRVHNIILYLLSLPLVYGSTLGIWRYFRPADVACAPWAAAAITALFTLHPSHVEAVVWISGRKDMLSGLFSLLALWLAIKAKREQNLSPRYATATLLALIAAMLSKATAVAVAPVIALLWIIFWRDHSTNNRRYSELLWAIASLLLAVCVALIFTKNSTIKEPVYFGIETVTRALAVLGWLARLAITPESRHYFYPVIEGSQFSIMVAMGITVLAATVTGGVLVLRKRSLEGFALFSFLLFCVPYLQFIPYRAHSLVTDRFLELAEWPVVILIVAMAWRFKPALRVVLLLAIALFWGGQTIDRPNDWKSFEVLIDSDFHACPECSLPAVYKSRIQLSKGLFREAWETANGIEIPELRNITTKLVEAHQSVTRSNSTGDPHDAMDILMDFARDLKQLPVQAQWNTSLRGIWYINQNYLLFEWHNLIRHFPDDALLRYNAGTSLLNIRNEDAIVQLRAAAESPHLQESMRGTVLKDFGLALLDIGRTTEAEAPLRAALEQFPPELSVYCILTKVYMQSNRLEEAERADVECRKIGQVKNGD